MANVIGKYCSVAKRDEIITPKNIPGYITPEGQTLKEDGQQLTFVYTPINYKIDYDLDSGSFVEGESGKTSYTVESDSYTPPTPIREDHQFTGWEPKLIQKGSIGDISFKATWKDNAILIKGTELNKLIDKYFGKETIMSLASSMSLVEDEKIPYYNISSTDTPIYVWSTGGTLWFYCKEEINVPLDMTSAFEGCTLLRDISVLSSWKTKTKMTISNMFKGCTLLSNVSAVSNWSNGDFLDFRGAFEGTSAVEAGRVPEWYKWEVTVHYTSSTGKEIETEIKKCIPDQTLYAKLISGYTIVNSSVVITSPSLEYTFTYTPNTYNIYYDLNEGTLLNPKTSYTIEDETYTPADPIRDGYFFTGWSPVCIEEGSYGNVTFIASYAKNNM